MNGTSETRHGDRSRRVLWSAAILLICCGSMGHAGRVLDIRKSVSALTADVRLGDLVVDSSVLAEEERDLVVFPAPPLGTERRHSLVEVAYRLQRCPTLLDASLRGTDAVLIRRDVDEERVRDVKDRIRGALARTEPWSGWTIDVHFSLDDDRKLTAAAVGEDVEVRALDHACTLGSVPLQVTILDEDGRRCGTCRIAPTILRELEAVVMASSRERGYVLAASDLRVTRLWTGNSQQDLLLDPERCVGKELSRRLDAGDMVREHHLLLPVCARRGEVVWVTCRSGELEVRMAGMALQTGREGDVVRVRNPSSKREIKVRLTGRKSAFFDLNG